VRAKARLPRKLRTRGACVDLRAIADRLNAKYFEGALRFEISFGRVVRGRRPRQTIQFGVYDARAKWIRIHPLLDAPWIPKRFVEFIVYHEMLHAAEPPVRDRAGGFRHHGPQFRERERRFVGHAAALAWEKRNIRKLLREARKLEPRTEGTPIQLRFDF
jgi:hypothetical protein